MATPSNSYVQRNLERSEHTHSLMKFISNVSYLFSFTAFIIRTALSLSTHFLSFLKMFCSFTPTAFIFQTWNVK